MTSPLITSYLTGLRRSLPAPVADEAADGLIETYEQHLATGAGDQLAARAALADFGDLAMVVGEYTRQAPGRRAGRPPALDGQSRWSIAAPGPGRYLQLPGSRSAMSCS